MYIHNIYIYIKLFSNILPQYFAICIFCNYKIILYIQFTAGDIHACIIHMGGLDRCKLQFLATACTTTQICSPEAPTGIITNQPNL